MFEINESTIISAMLILIVFILLFGMLIWNEEALNFEYRCFWKYYDIKEYKGLTVRFASFIF